MFDVMAMTNSEDRKAYSDLSHQILQYAALRQMGCSWQQIVKALRVGELGCIQLSQIDMMVCIWNVMQHGLPPTVSVTVPKDVKCPRCDSMVAIVPCRKCVVEGAWPSGLDDLPPDVEIF